jgi:putative transposase
LIFDYQAFSVKDDTVLLEKDLELQLPEQLKGQKIQQVEIIPKPNCFHAVFVYEENPANFVQVGQSDQTMSIDLGLNNLATCVTNGVIEPFIIDGRRLKSINAYYNKRKAFRQSSQRETG